jgi:GntR family transcriptional regulator/MocR family aminotransferase
MVDAFRETFGDRVQIVGENAGVHMVLWLRGVPAAREETLVERAADRRVGIYSVLPHYLEPPDVTGLLLGYASMTEREIREGVRLLGEVVEKMS